MTGWTAELEGLHILVAEERHLLVPVGDRLVPVSGRSRQGLLVDVKVLPNSKPASKSHLQLPPYVMSDTHRLVFLQSEQS